MKPLKYIYFYLIGPLILSTSNGYATELCIEKGTLNPIKSNESALGYFHGPAYYLLNDKSSNVVSQFREKPAFLKDDTKAAAFFALNRADAESMKAQYESAQTRGVATIKKAPLSAIMWQQFKVLSSKTDGRAKLPDFVIFQHYPPL